MTLRPAPTPHIRGQLEATGPSRFTSEAATSEVPQGADLPSMAAEGLTQQHPRAGTGAALRAILGHKAVAPLEREKGREVAVWLCSLIWLSCPHRASPSQRGPGSRRRCWCSRSGPGGGSGHHCRRSPGGWHSPPHRGPRSPWGPPGGHRRPGRVSCSSDRRCWPDTPRLTGKSE